MEDRYVEIMGAGGRSSGNLLQYLKDEANGQYLRPVQKDRATIDQFEKNAMKEVSRLAFLNTPGSTDEEFEEQWPAIWEELQKPSEDEQVSDTIVAIFDTGLMSEHPLIKGCVEAAVDFTGEGTEDLHGHGTVVALLTDTRRSKIAKYRRRPRFVNVKVVDKSGLGRPENLIRGLRWLMQYKEEQLSEESRILANLSLGVYSKRLLLFRCRGDCTVCSAAIEAADQDIWIQAAAGNKAGVTSCPAIAGLIGKHEAIFAISATDYEQSGRGWVGLPSTLDFESL